ncbi:MAG: DUF5642 family protein [Mycobacterium sp.]
MRRFALISTTVLLCVAACGQTGGPTSGTPTTASSQSAQVNPANIARVRGELPAGYEVADVSGPASPVAFWGFGPGWVTDPPGCGALASPVPDGAATSGWSGSGPGGIVYAVATGSPPARIELDPAVVAECGQWTVMSGQTTGAVSLIEAPSIDDAATVGMSTVATTVVEGGTETTSTASTFSAYLGDYLAFVTVVTDPGSPNPPLGQDFAAALLAETVSALRG